MQKRAVKVARRAGLVSSAATELPSDFSSEEEEEEEVKENVSFVNGTRQQHESTPIVKQHRLTIKRTPATPASSLQSVRQEEIDEFYAAGSNNNFIPSQPRIQRTPVGVIKQQENADNASDCENNDLYQGSPAPASSRRKSVMFQMPATEEKVVVQSQAVEDDIPWNDNNDQVYDCGAGEDYYKDCVASEAVDCDDKNKQQEEPPIPADDCFDNFSSEKEEQIMQKSKPKKSAMKKQQHKQPPAELTAEDEMRLKIFNKGGLKEINTDDGQVVKRSSRMRYRPLEFWRNERVVFGRRKSGMFIIIKIISLIIKIGPFPVPVIQEIVRVPQEEMSAKEKREKRQRQFVKKCQPIVSIVDPKGQDKKEIEKGFFYFMILIISPRKKTIG
jgi:hypothetical protein